MLQQSSNPIIIYDGNCNLCNFWVNFISRHDREELFFFTHFQSDVSKRLLEKHNIGNDITSSVILIEDDKLYHRSSAIIKVFQLLKFPYSILGIIKYVPIKMRDDFYELISSHQYKWFGRNINCMIPNEKIKQHILQDLTE